VCAASTALGNTPPFFSTFHSGAMLGRFLMIELVLGPRRQLGQLASLSMPRGDR
jgi:hypothetical protein